MAISKEDVREAASTVVETLDLELNPVAVRLYLSEDDVPDGYERAEEELRHCEFVMRVARGDLDKVYATPDEQVCKGGASAIGLVDIPAPVRDGRFYHEQLGQHATLTAAKRTVDQVPKAYDGEGVYEAVTYERATEADVVPDSVLIICPPKEAMHIVQAYLYQEGGRVQTDFSGIQSLCGDAVGGIIKRGGINVTLGCNGSRTYAEVPRECVIIGLEPAALKRVGEAITEIPIP